MTSFLGERFDSRRAIFAIPRAIHAAMILHPKRDLNTDVPLRNEDDNPFVPFLELNLGH